MVDPEYFDYNVDSLVSFCSLFKDSIFPVAKISKKEHPLLFAFFSQNSFPLTHLVIFFSDDLTFLQKAVLEKQVLSSEDSNSEGEQEQNTMMVSQQ